MKDYLSSSSISTSVVITFIECTQTSFLVTQKFSPIPQMNNNDLGSIICKYAFVHAFIHIKIVRKLQFKIN